MADPRLASHQQFDALRCRLCNNIYGEPKLLSCLHSFCLFCLEKYVKETANDTANQIHCPMCKEITELSPASGIAGLTENTLIKRYITQAHRDTTQQVAGREVLELQKSALTEEDLRHPEIVSSIHHIADTASHIIAGAIQEQSQVHDYDTVMVRQDLQSRTIHLQEKALDIVYAIDQVNQEAAEWMENRNRIRDRIKMRSTEIQNIVQSIERKLLLSVDDKEMEAQFKNMCFGVKTKLHKTLKSDLTTVDFIKLLAEFGDAADLQTFVPITQEKERAILSGSIDMKIDSFMFEQPTVDMHEALELMFGGLTQCTVEKAAWDPAHTNREQKSQPATNDSSPASDIESHSTLHGLKTEAILTTNYTEIDENKNHRNENSDNTEHGARFEKRFEEGKQKVRRRPMKSMSFDYGKLSSPYMSATQRNQHHEFREGDQGNPLSDNGTNSTDTHGNAVREPHINGDRINSAIQSLNPNAERKAWARRVSAPSSTIIDTLNRRRLSALSILERANISTEGLNMSSDVESGLNEARLEWLRENFHRRVENVGRQSSVNEEV